MRNLPAYVVSVLVLAAFSFYYFIVLARPLGVAMVNAAVAFSAVILIGISFVLGPLGHFSRFFVKFDGYRKTFGLIGYALAALHIALTVPMLLQSPEEGSLALIVSIAVAAIAFMIFTLMALTSTAKWVDALGFENWKSLQRTGYIAIVLVLFHIVLIDKGVFLTRITGQVAIGFILLILLLRALAFVTNKVPGKIIL